MAEGYGPLSCASGFVPKSKLLHNPELQYGLVSKLSHHGGKSNRACALKNQVSLSRDYRPMRGIFDPRAQPVFE